MPDYKFGIIFILFISHIHTEMSFWPIEE